MPAILAWVAASVTADCAAVFAALVPNPAVSPDSNALLPEPPDSAYVANPAPIPAANAELAANVVPNIPAPAKELKSVLPNKGAKKGKKASGCPVCGLTVKGIADANPLTSAGLTCISIESP